MFFKAFDVMEMQETVYCALVLKPNVPPSWCAHVTLTLLYVDDTNATQIVPNPVFHENAKQISNLIIATLRNMFLKATVFFLIYLLLLRLLTKFTKGHDKEAAGFFDEYKPMLMNPYQFERGRNLSQWLSMLCTYLLW